MPHHYAHTGQGTLIMRCARMVGGKRYLSRAWYYRTRRGGRTTYFPLGRDWAKACSSADRIDNFLTWDRSSGSK